MDSPCSPAIMISSMASGVMVAVIRRERGPSVTNSCWSVTERVEKPNSLIARAMRHTGLYDDGTDVLWLASFAEFQTALVKRRPRVLHLGRVVPLATGEHPP